MSDYHQSQDEVLSHQERFELLSKNPEALEVRPDDLNNFFEKLPGHPMREARLAIVEKYPEDQREKVRAERVKYYNDIDEALKAVGFDLEKVIARVREFAQKTTGDQAESEVIAEEKFNLLRELKLIEVYKYLRNKGYSHHDLYA